MKKEVLLILLIPLLFASSSFTYGQNTQIRGFVDALTSLENGKVSFGFGEQDLFITSELSDRLSFLGESVFKFTPTSPTEFSVSIERIVLKYNLIGNHNVIIGKHHTPLNYWNDTYHHGRVFFPTIDRPLLFAANIIPLHTTGISLQGHDLGSIKFGYDLMIGNGLGSSEIADNDKNKSITLALHIKPVDKLRIGLSWYNDIISKGATVHDRLIDARVNQNLYSGSIAYFGKKVELLAEGTYAVNRSDLVGSKYTTASYAYAGYKIKGIFVPYVRFDDLRYQAGEMLFTKDNMNAFVVGIRCQVNYLAVIKLEFQHQNAEFEGSADKLTAQFAIGF
jgi:hypothetical protein